MYTRKDYLNKKCTHRQYYAQFVNGYIKQSVLRQIGKKALLNSKDKHLNDIALSRWDNFYPWLLQGETGKNFLKISGQKGYSLSDTVCIAKEAAQQIIEQNKS